jgi:hypothetical protein
MKDTATNISYIFLAIGIASEKEPVSEQSGIPSDESVLYYLEDRVILNLSREGRNA